jgi:hypothetical protein
MVSQPGDFIGQGLTYAFSSGNAMFTFNATVSGLSASLSANDGQTWSVDMYPATGQILAPGNYPNATRYPFNGRGNGLNVDGDSRGCNTLTGSFYVKQVTFSAVDNSLRHFDGFFVQHCEGAPPALYGELKYNSAPVVTSPPGVTNLAATHQAGGLSVTWQNPSASGYRYTLIRIEAGTPAAVAAFAGLSGYAGSGTSTTIKGLHSGSPYTLVAFTVDQYGNVSYPVELQVTG